MKKLVLDHTQRLNLHVLMGQQRANLDDMRLLWKMQDRIAVSDEEKKAIGFQVVSQPNGMQQTFWDQAKVSAQEYTFSKEEYDRLARVVKEWQPGFLPSGDRLWLEPLLDQLDRNGQPAQ